MSVAYIYFQILFIVSAPGCHHSAWLVEFEQPIKALQTSIEKMQSS